MVQTQGYDVVADRLKALGRRDELFVVGLTGSVASGKTTLAKGLAAALEPIDVAHVTTDGFLFPNAVLKARDQMLRKGFPETYDRATMAAAIEALRAGPAEFPVYDHVTYDVHPTETRRLDQPDMLILEGLGLRSDPATHRGGGAPDLLIYLDALEADIETWFLERFLRFWRAAETDPSSFYAQWLHMSENEITEFARGVWANINLPNLQDHIAPIRAEADLVLRKHADHSVRIVEDRL
ncbi:MAG: type I pantothenate kinase [Pseudomonadota bacterium]